jgi:hypothetical protein
MTMCTICAPSKLVQIPAIAMPSHSCPLDMNAFYTLRRQQIDITLERDTQL